MDSTTQIKINSDHHYFNGHFINNPIFPAFGTLELVFKEIELKLKIKPSQISWQKIRLLKTIKPEDVLQIEISEDQNKLVALVKVNQSIVFQGNGKINL